MAKINEKVFAGKAFVYCKTKKEAKKLLKAARHNLSLSFIHEKSTAVMEYEPDENFWKKYKGKCCYSLYYRKKATKDMALSIGGNIIKFKDAFKKKKKSKKKK